MKQGTKNTDTNDLRAKADTDIEAWRAATAASEAAHTACSEVHSAAEKGRASYGPRSPEVSLKVIVAEVSRLELEDVARTTLVKASVSLDAAEVAEGDELALACDPAHLHTDLAALHADTTRLRAELAAAEKRWTSRILRAQDSTSALAARRSKQGLPPPVSLPRNTDAMGRDLGPESFLSRLAARATEDMTPTRSNAAQIQGFRMRETETRAAIERAHREAEERAAARAEHERQKEAERKAEQERSSRQHKELQDKYDAKQREIAELANAQRAREAAAR
jgi:hypothetical protein